MLIWPIHKIPSLPTSLPKQRFPLNPLPFIKLRPVKIKQKYHNNSIYSRSLIKNSKLHSTFNGWEKLNKSKLSGRHKISINCYIGVENLEYEGSK